MDQIHAPKKSIDRVDAVKIVGGYDDYMITMAKNHKQKNEELFENEIVVDRYNDVERKRTRKGKACIASFSSQMFSSSTIQDGASTTTYLNILTGQQQVEVKRTQIFFLWWRNYFVQRQK